MNEKKKLLSLFLCLCLILSTFTFVGITASAYTATSGWGRYGCYEYVFNFGEATVYSCDPSVEGSIEIPNEIEGCTVTSIGNKMFYDCTKLTSITIPDSVTSIGEDAFYNCKSLKSVSIGDSVTSIGSSAFYGTGYYNNYHNWEDNILYIGDYLIEAKEGYFEGNETPTDYILKTKNDIKEGTRVIADSAFKYYESLEEVIIPDSVTNIGKYVFEGCSSLASITIPDSVTSIDESAFSGCSIKDLIIAEGSETVTSTIVVCESSLETVTIPNSVTSIGEDAFEDCTSLKSITIPNNVTSIGDYAFDNCKSLTSITIPNSVTSIGKYAFYKCKALTSITIPDSVTSIGEDAFEDCTSLTSITIPNSVTSISGCAFYNCTSLTSVNIPDSVTSIGYSAFKDCTSLTSINIPNSVTSIGHSAFKDCTSLKNIIIPDSVTSIGESAFDYTGYYNSESNWENDVLYMGKRLIGAKTTISGDYTIKNGTKLIAGFAFGKCSLLKSITIPDSVTSIGSGAFYRCSSLAKITIPNSVTTIGDYAFEDCTSLRIVSIGDSVTNIGVCAFFGCSSLKSVSIGNGVTSIGSCAFYGCYSITVSLYCDCKNDYIKSYLTRESISFKLDAHYFENYISNNDATCTENGTETAKCECCDATDTREDADSALGHTEVVDKVVSPTCTKTGLTQGKHCSVCGEVLVKQEVVTKLKHEFKTYVSNNDATCTENGTETAKCERCDATNTREIKKTALGHKYSKEWSTDKEAVCVGGEMSKHCIRFDECGERTDITPLPEKHTTSEWEIVTEATQTEQGIKRKICTVCKKVLKVEYFDFVDDSTTQPTTKPSTQPSVCVHSNTTLKNKAEPTYFGAGYLGDKVCVKCGEKITKGKAIAKLTLKTPKFKLTKGKKQFKVKYTKVAGATGFQVRYKIKGKWKTKTFNTKKTATKLIKKLKKGTYQVQIRAMVVSGSKKAYSTWSKLGRVKVK